MSSKIVSNMAGTLLEVTVKVGDTVKAGQEVFILESMKMEVPIASSVAGKVTAILKVKGDFVNEGEPVIEMA
ncbi:MAG: biotin/lipoyl-containing protein [Pseudomonadota bacterium]